MAKEPLPKQVRRDLCYSQLAKAKAKALIEEAIKSIGKDGWTSAYNKVLQAGELISFVGDHLNHLTPGKK